MPLNIDSVLTDLYADDTTLYYIEISQACIEQQLQTALHKLSEWSKENGMLINTAKTKVMLITTPQKRIHLNNNNLQLTYNNEELSVVASDKILGVLIDNNLTWTNHIDAVAKKIVSNVWLLSRIKEYLSSDQRVQFYKSYVQPHIEELKILNIFEQIFLKKAKFMFKISQSLTPEYINEMFQLQPLNNTLQSLRSSTTIIRCQDLIKNYLSRV